MRRESAFLTSLILHFQEFFIRDVKKGNKKSSSEVDETDGDGLSTTTILVGNAPIYFKHINYVQIHHVIKISSFYRNPA